MKIKIIYFFLFLFFFQLKKSFAFDYPPITYLGIEQGLSNNSVRCIYQDHNNFMWFGTYDGLSRYDGYEFKVFRSKINDSNSLPHNYIYAISEDEQNNLWVGTGQGIGIYNSLTANWQPEYYMRLDGRTRQKNTSNITYLQKDDTGNMFIGTNGLGLIMQEKDKKDGLQIAIAGNDKNGTYNVEGLKIDAKKRVWVFIQTVGLCLYNYHLNKVVPVTNELTAASCIEPGNDNVWIGTDSGLYEYNISSNKITKHYTEDPGSLTSNKVATLFLDKDVNLWIGTEGDGLNVLNTFTGKFSYLLPGQEKNSLSSESVAAVYEDKENRKWIGTLKGGIDILDPEKNRFTTISHNALNPNSLINNFVSAFYEDEKGSLWIGTDGGGFSIWDRHNNIFHNYRNDHNKANSLSSNQVTCIKQDHEKNIWISTYGGGINKFNPASGTFDHYQCFDPGTGKVANKVWLLYEDKELNLWATTFGGSFYLFNPKQNEFQLFDSDLTNLIAIDEDSRDNLWAGDSHQLILIDKKNKNHRFFEIGKPVRSIYEDRRGNLWLGTEGGGLILFNRNSGKIIKRYSDADGLCNNSVLNILEDKNGNLWLSTFNGLCKFDTKTKTFKNYYQSDGLQSNQFLFSAAVKLHSGELVFGGIKGFTLFVPDSLRLRSYVPKLVFTDLKINNEPVSADNSWLVKTVGNNITELKIPYDKAVLFFQFAALEYTAPEKISYAYYLQGWDKGWNYTADLRTANYTHLSEGTYTFRVRSTNSDGTWSANETNIRIIILPPWYRTWWAYLLYAAIIGSAVYLFLMYKVKQTRLKYKIKLAKINAQKEHEINEKKLSFFTDVSHEFRTPLSLIINPLKDVLDKSGSAEEKKELNVVYRNARRLLSLVDQLLLFRKADTETDQLKISLVNFKNLCYEVYLCFVQQARSKSVEYRFECANENIYLYVDKEKIEISLFNLLSNAMKYTPGKGRIIFKIEEKENDVLVSLSDTGVGISDEEGDRLFEKFYRVGSGTGTGKSGFGIGLYLAKHFVDNHKGEIYYESAAAKGTTFFIKLKKGKEHLCEQKVCEDVMVPSDILHELVEDPVSVQQTDNRLAEIITGKLSLLIVDDDLQLLEYIRGIFSEKFVIYQATNGNDALVLAKKNVPDIVISDITMGGMDGIELCKNIKSIPSLSHTPVILLTGASSKETELKSIEKGADDYISKPFEKEFLLAKVLNIVKSRDVIKKYFYNEITLQENNLKVSENYKEFLEKCIQIVEMHLDDDQFNIQKLSQEIGMSHSALYKKIKEISGQSANGFIRFIRLRKAAELFINTNCNVNQVAFEIGMNDLKYFRMQFNKLFGMNPSEYIRKFRKPFSQNFTLSDQAVKQ
jgi:ligand-binding sensor domain-containing protein/signal transduction histidine kinase/DNA-binding response OmpR family regulator